FSKTEIRRAMVTLNEKTHVQENVILSTCNRTEIFAVVECKTDGRQDIITFLVEWFQIDASEFMDYFQFVSGDNAIYHAFKLAAGLDSMVLGETQILGQVKEAFFIAQHVPTTGKLFNE